MWTRSELKERGKAAFKANYIICVLVSLVALIITGAQGGSGSGRTSDSSSYQSLEGYENDGDVDAAVAEITQLIQDAETETGWSTGTIVGIILGTIFVSMVIAILIQLLVKNVLNVGIVRFYVENAASPAKFTEIFYGFTHRFGRNIAGMFLMNLFVALWSLLLIIPGIIKAYEYMMVPYILADDEDVSIKEAFAKSKAMMTGNKWDTFVLQLSFFGWYLLTLLTCGIVGVFYVNPYMDATMAELYLALKGNA